MNQQQHNTHSSKPLKILVLHAQNTFNNGSFMLLINFVYYAWRQNPGLEFIIDLQSKEDEDRLRKELPSEINITCFDLHITSPFHGNIFQKINQLHTKLYCHINHFRKLGIDNIVILGGDDLSEYYKGWQISSDLYRIRRYSRKMPVFLVGQTLGPFYSWRKKWAQHCLSRTRLYFRDELSQQQSKSYIRPLQAFSGADLAFPDLPVQTKSNISATFIASNTKYIVVVPSGNSQLYTRNTTSYYDSWCRIMQELAKLPCIQSYTLLLLPHVTRPEDDRALIRFIMKQLEILGLKNRIQSIDKELLPTEAREIIGEAAFTISGRMHPAISSYSCGKPAIVLACGIKYEGIIGQGMNRYDLLIHANAKDLWVAGNIAEPLSQKVEYLMQDYSRICGEISLNMAHMKEKALSMISTLTKHFDSSSDEA